MSRQRYAVWLVSMLVAFLLLACASPGTGTAQVSSSRSQVSASKVETRSDAKKPLKRHWAYDHVGTRTAGKTGAGVRIAILDTGVAPDHEDLPTIGKGVNTCEKPDANTTNTADRNGHGTQLAGIVAGKDEPAAHATRGAAPAATITPIKIDCGVVTTDALKRGLDAAIGEAGKHPDVILLALGGYPDGGLDELGTRISANPNILFVIASIWDGVVYKLPAWAAQTNVIVVSAMTIEDDANGKTKEVAYRSDRTGDLWAPGRDVETADSALDPRGGGYHAPYLMQGTSAAAAMVAGCAALIRDQPHPGLPPQVPAPPAGKGKLLKDKVMAFADTTGVGKSLRCFK